MGSDSPEGVWLWASFARSVSPPLDAPALAGPIPEGDRLRVRADDVYVREGEAGTKLSASVEARVHVEVIVPAPRFVRFLERAPRTRAR